MFRKAFMLLALAVALASHAHADTLVGVTDQNALVVIDSAQPSLAVNTAVITGVQPGEIIVALDFDPNSEQLFGLSSLDRLFRLDVISGVASLVNDKPFKKGILGDLVTLEVDPVIGDIRVLDNLGLNAALDSVLGTVTGLVGLLLYPLGDVNFLQVPEIISGAIDNGNLLGSTGLLYVIDEKTGYLCQVVGGLITTINSIAPISGIPDVGDIVGFDIATSGTAIIANLLSGEGTSLHLLNLLNGTTTLLGSINLNFSDITIIGGNPVIPPSEEPEPDNPDLDGDGVLNAGDRCPNTPSGALVDQYGCSIEQLCPCSGPRVGGTYAKKGYSKCIKEQTKRLKKAGIITKTEAKTLSKAAKSSPCNPPKR